MFFRSRKLGRPSQRRAREPGDVAERLGVPTPDQHRELVLYKFDSCPYCRRVMRVVDELEVDLVQRDTIRDRQARTQMIEATGRTQVPCLFIDGIALFESTDIIDWLRSYAEHASA